MSKKSIVAGLLLSTILMGYQVHAETIVSNIGNTTVVSSSTEKLTESSTIVEVPKTEQPVVQPVEPKVQPIESSLGASIVEQPKTEQLNSIAPTEVTDKSVDNTVDKPVENKLIEDPKVLETKASETKEPVVAKDEESDVSSTESSVSTKQAVTPQVQQEVIHNQTTQVQQVQADAQQNQTVDVAQTVVHQSEQKSVKPVGTLTKLGVSDKTKPVGTLTYYRQTLPNTGSKHNTVGVITGVVILTGLLISGLYQFSKRIFS